MKSSLFKDVPDIKYWKCPNEIGVTAYIKYDMRIVIVEVLHYTCTSRFYFVDTNLLPRKRFVVTGVSELVGLRNLEYLRKERGAFYSCSIWLLLLPMYCLEAHYRVSITNTNTQCRSIRTCYGYLSLKIGPWGGGEAKKENLIPNSHKHLQEVVFQNVMKITINNRCNNFILRYSFTGISLKIYIWRYFKKFLVYVFLICYFKEINFYQYERCLQVIIHKPLRINLSIDIFMYISHFW